MLGYDLNVTDIEGGVSMANLTVSANDTKSVTFSNLTIYWMYGVRIRAFTKHGAGPFSDERKAKTEESGKLSRFLK